MAADNLPSEFDVVILGTGLSESVIAAACSRVGQRVLHVDRRNYYAGNWASFTFNGLLSWIDEYKQGGQSPGDVKDWREKVEEGEEVLLLDSMDTSLSNVEVFCYAGEEPEDKGKEKVGASLTATEKEVPEPKEDNEDEVTVRDATPVDRADQQEQQVGDATSQEQNQAKAEEQPGSPIVCEEEKEKISYTKIVKEGRRFNIDLVSKLMYSRGLLVDLLIKSNVSRYAEFKNVSRVLTYRDGKIEQVPCSRADVFGSKQLTVVEKRMLMKFLTFCMDYEQHPEEYQEFKELSFWDFLQTKKLTENLQHFILHSIAMVHPETRTEEGLRSTQHFLHSLGRYGNTPFLFPIYGFGEIPQCFCRMCAVFGGIYCLRHSIQCLVLDKESGRCKAVIDTCGQRISCSHFVVEDSYIGEEQRRGVQYRQISRAVLITDGSLLPPESEQQISLVNIPPLEPGQQAVQVIELCSSSMTCMPGTYLVHLTCPASSSACEDLAQVVSKLFTVPQRKGEADEAEDGRPHVLWALYFNMRDSSGVDGSAYSLPSNVYVCSGPDASLGSDFCIRLAETVFHQILPNEEFCPPAPNPEDIVYEGDAAPAEGAGFGESAGMGGDEAEGQHEVETDVTCSGGDQNPAEERATDSAAGQDVSPTATEE